MLNNTKQDYATIKLNAYEQIAKDLGKAVKDLVPWVDYDPISIDNSCYYASKGLSGVRYTGD